MRKAVGAVALLILFNLYIIGGTATGTGRAWPLAQGLLWSAGIAVGVYLLTRSFTSAIDRARNGVQPRAPVALRVLVVVALVAISEILVVTMTPSHLAWFGEVLYYVVLLSCGAGLAGWARTSAAAPVWTATLVLLVPAVVDAARLASDADARFQYGPEVYLFMLWGYAGHLNMLPLDVVVAWAGWRAWVLYSARRAA